MRGSALPSALGLNQACGEIAKAADGRRTARDIVFVGLAGAVDPEGAETERRRTTGVPGVGRDKGDLVRLCSGPGAASFVDLTVRLEDPQRRDGKHGLQRVLDSGCPQSVFQHVRIAVGEGRHAQPSLLQCLQRAGDFGKGVQPLVCQQQPSDIAILVASAHVDREYVAKAREAGANWILVKPLTFRRLYEGLVNVIMDERAFVEGDVYVGPDRRVLVGMAGYDGVERRKDAQP